MDSRSHSSPSPDKAPLAELSPNTTSPTKAHTHSADLKFRPEMLKDENASGSQQHQEEGGAKQQSYISPSDNIMSPTTKKLSEIKGRRFGAAKPQSLFAKMLGRQALKSEDGAAGGVTGGIGADAGKV